MVGFVKLLSSVQAAFNLNFCKDLRLYYHVQTVRFQRKDLVPQLYLDISKSKISTGSPKSTSTNLKRPSNKIIRNSKEKRLDNSGKVSKEYLYGISPCLAALEANRRRFYMIFVNEDASNMKTRLPQFEQIRYLAKRRMVATKAVSKNRLDSLCGNRPHQNIVMKVGKLSMIPLQEDFRCRDAPIENSNKRPPLWLVLEGIQDPMNLGAILRTSAYLGVDKVVSSESDSCSLTPAVSKASAGAMEVLPLYSANVVQLFEKKKADNWQILGTVHPGFEAVHSKNCVGNSPPVVACDRFQLEEPSVLVLGNEGSGLTKDAQGLCTKFLTIPSQMRRPIGDLDSLNVSVATGILLHSVLTPRAVQG